MLDIHVGVLMILHFRLKTNEFSKSGQVQHQSYEG